MAKRKFDPVRPGVVLAEDFLKGMDNSQYRLAKGIGVSRRRISEIVQGGLTFLLAAPDRPRLSGRSLRSQPRLH